MKRRTALPELLAPAGDFECLVAAVAAGADAVYVGGRMFSARAYAKNFDIDELRRAAVYCHLHGVKLYLTVNTLLYDREMLEAIRFALSAWRVGVDALIVADLGLISLLKREIPEIEIHASTQMSVYNSEGADMAYKLGCERVVLARELSGKNIRLVTESCLAETEVFLHGALCVSYSGQCLFSSLVGGRSGNRGECAQPCRLPYNGGYPLSLKDLSLAGHIPELIESGTASLKIEGRMKSPDYVYTVVSVYRRLIDEGRRANREEEEILARAFSRSGFTDGYFTEKIERGMTGIRTEGDKESSRSVSGGEYKPTPVATKASATFRLGEPSEMTLELASGRSVTVTGATPREALNSPLTSEGLSERLSKMGGTFFALSREDIKITLDEGINLSPGEINALRRDAVAALEGEEREVPDITDLAKYESPRVEKRRTAVFYNTKAFERAALDGYFDISFIPLYLIDECERMPNGVMLPPVVMEDEREEVLALIKAAKERGCRYALVGNIGLMELATLAGLQIVGDFRLNITNSYTEAAYRKMGIEATMVSPELTAREAGELASSGIVYGRIPLMVTERCFIKENFGCKGCGASALTDRRGAKFPMLREFGHRNLILNSAVTYLADKPSERASLCGEHYIFTTESATEITATVAAYKRALPAPPSLVIRRMGKRRADK